MEITAFSELFPLFKTANRKTVEWLLSESLEHKYPSGRTIILEDSWGNAVYFIISGWVKVRGIVGQNYASLAILGQGDFFGEMAVLDESPRSSDVVALSEVCLLSISAQKFIQALFKDPQLHHRLLQLMVRRLKHFNARFEIRNSPPAIKLAKTLVFLAESCGNRTEKGIEIFQISYQDLADVSDITEEEALKILQKLEQNGWITIDTTKQVFCLVNIKQLTHLGARLYSNY